MTEKEHVELAKKILQNLVQRCENYQGGTKFITYGEIAKEINYPEPYTGSNFANRIGKTLGVMGHCIKEIKAPDWIGRTPYIQSLVVAKSTKLPSDGLKEFYPQYPYLSKKKKIDFLSKEYRKIFKFGDRWHFVLKKMNTKPIKSKSNSNTSNSQGNYNPFGSEGSPEHRSLRDYIASNPNEVLFNNTIEVQTEYPLKSGDSIDVKLENGERILGVEVKSLRSGEDDLLRGIFQCIKYREVLKAEAMIDKIKKSIDCILVHEGDLTKKLIKIAKTLNVKTVQKKVN